MKIMIHYSTRIGTIKQVFHKNFPNLRIEFFKQPSNGNGPIAQLPLHNMFVGEINSGLKQGSVNIKADDSIVEVKKIFLQHFGLPVQIFRREKKVWVSTFETSHLSLSEENKKGEMSCVNPVYQDAGQWYAQR